MELRLYNLNFNVNFKYNLHSFAAPSKCRPVQPAPPHPPRYATADDGDIEFGTNRTLGTSLRAKQTALSGD